MTKLVHNFLEAYIKFWNVTFKALKQYSEKQRTKVNGIWNWKYMQKNTMLSNCILFLFINS